MNMITRIARKLGYHIAKIKRQGVSTEEIMALHPEVQHGKALISLQEAIEALQSVKRQTGLSSFTYYSRPEKSSELMEQLENSWWNAHGRLIEKVWVFSDDVNYRYRHLYVKKAGDFFRKNGMKAKVLDLGCGSGWMGRMIADRDLEYFGLDFSSTQIDIANSEKQSAPNKEYLHYYCADSLEKIENIHEITGVVIHAFLHHLYWEDLKRLFSELVEVLPHGCKFFIVEPVYPNLDITNKTIAQQESNINLVKAFRTRVAGIKKELIEKRCFDTRTESELIHIATESQTNGFFLSPKEVPFRLAEIEAFLAKYVHIENTYHCGVLNLETAQLIEKITDRELRVRYSDLLFPLADSLDALLLQDHYFDAHKNEYLFTAFECTLNKQKNRIKLATN